MEFDPVAKPIVGLKVPVGLNILKEYDLPNPQILEDLIVTETVVGSITSLYEKISLRYRQLNTHRKQKRGIKS